MAGQYSPFSPERLIGPLLNHWFAGYLLRAAVKTARTAYSAEKIANACCLRDSNWSGCAFRIDQKKSHTDAQRG
jgi:hypothetical protein